MKLKEYLDSMHIKITHFARDVGVSLNTLLNIIDESRECRLSTALEIERLSKRAVTCEELRLDKNHRRKNSTSLQKKTKKKKESKHEQRN